MSTNRSNLLAMIPAGRKVLAVVLLCAGYYLGTVLGYALIFPESYISVIWPPNTLLLVALLLASPGKWVWLLAAVLPVHLLAQAHQGTGLGMASLYYLHDCVLVPLTAWGLRRFGLATMELTSLRDALVFIAVVTVATAVGCLPWSPIIVWIWIGGDLWTPWSLAFLSNYVPFLIATPCLVIGLTRGPEILRNVHRRQSLEFLLMTIGLVICAVVLFSLQARFVYRMPALLYAPLPLLLWAAVRFGPAGVSFSCLIFSLMAIRNATSGHGPLLALSPGENVLWLQMFLLALYLPMLLVAAAVKEQRAKSEALKESETHYRGVVEDQTELICRFQPDGSYTFVNGAYCRHFNRSPQEFLGRTFWDFIPPEGHEASRAFLASITPEHPVATIEYQVVAPGSEMHWLQWTDRGFFDENGRILEYQAVGRDITERKRFEESLQDALRDVSRLKERLEAENTYLQQELSSSETIGDVVCRSEAMRNVLAQVQRVAATGSTVLILGETGVGKEVVARAVHRGSAKSHLPFVRVNCAALPAHLIESELFGYERGAFTGAASRRLGRFEVADGATLFLDEIGELPVEVQAKLLRVLQEGEFERLGSSETIKADVRLIAATSRDLVECVRKGSFRADLYYRLNVFPIVVPPLRGRKDDIVPLASAFLEKIARSMDRTFEPINKAAAQSLLGHNWPGNVRELHNVIERAVIWSQGTVLRLPPGWNGRAMGAGEALAAERPESAPESLVDAQPTAERLQSIQELERAHILSVLEHTKWRIEGPSGAATILGVKPSTLRFRMKKLAISRGIDPISLQSR